VGTGHARNDKVVGYQIAVVAEWGRIWVLICYAMLCTFSEQYGMQCFWEYKHLETCTICP
jgi:uncharacterized membrane protein